MCRVSVTMSTVSANRMMQTAWLMPNSDQRLEGRHLNPLPASFVHVSGKSELTFRHHGLKGVLDGQLTGNIILDDGRVLTIVQETVWRERMI